MRLARSWPVLALALLGAAVACTSLGGLSDAPPTDGPDGSPDGTTPNAACAPEAMTDPANCCGRACPVRANAYPVCAAGACGVGCNAGAGNCDGDDSNGCETNIATNAHACGACGHDCLGGECQDGQCKPVVLATNLNNPLEIAVNATNVYVTESITGNGRVVSCPIVGCGPNAKALAMLLETPTLIAIGPTQLAVLVGGFSPNDTIFACPLAGCVGAPTVIASAQRFVVGLHVAEPSVYWGIYDIPGSVLRASITGGPTAIVASGIGPNTASYDDTSVYFQDLADGGADFRSCPLATCNGGKGTSISPKEDFYAWSIAIDPTTLFVAANDVVKTVPIAGGDAGTLAIAQSQARHIVARGDDVYWTTTSAAGTVSRYSKSKKTVTVVASGLANPAGIAIDDAAVYWTNSSDGTIAKLAR